jgi:hypothetical protein
VRAKDRPLDNDFVSEAALAELLAAWFDNAARVQAMGRSLCIWGGFMNLPNYPPAELEARCLEPDTSLAYLSGGHNGEADRAGGLCLAKVERQEPDSWRGDPLCGREMERIQCPYAGGFRDQRGRIACRFVELDDRDGA